MAELTRSRIDPQRLIELVRSNRAGAVVLMLGVTREWTDGRRTMSLDYDSYEEMAARKLGELEREAKRRWPLLGCAIVHRLGRVEAGEASVGIAVSSAHREAAFEAGRWLIDALKKKAPIWKKENWDDGQSQWIHPGDE